MRLPCIEAAVFLILQARAGYNTRWPSDITVSINGMEIGTWTSPGDMGGEHGRLTPDWWTIENTQYGFLTTWKGNTLGSWMGIS